MADEEVQGWLRDYERRVQEAADQPITAGNVSRHVEAKMRAMQLLRHLHPAAPPHQRRAELQKGLDVLQAGHRQAGEGAAVQVRDDDMTPERRDLTQSGRQWLVPDMSDAQQLRFVLAPPNRALNEMYRQDVGAARGRRQAGAPPVVDALPDDNALHWAMSKAVVQKGATMRDWIAYALRVQVLLMKRFDLVEWVPYTQAIDRALWRQARVVLRCRRVEALDGVEMEDKKASMDFEEWSSTDCITNQRPLVHHQLQPPLNTDEQRKHALVKPHTHTHHSSHPSSLTTATHPCSPALSLCVSAAAVVHRRRTRPLRLRRGGGAGTGQGACTASCSGLGLVLLPLLPSSPVSTQTEAGRADNGGLQSRLPSLSSHVSLASCFYHVAHTTAICYVWPFAYRQSP